MGLRTNVVKRLYIFRVKNRINGETSIRHVEAESAVAARLKIEPEYEILQESGDETEIEWGDKEC